MVLMCRTVTGSQLESEEELAEGELLSQAHHGRPQGCYGRSQMYRGPSQSQHVFDGPVFVAAGCYRIVKNRFASVEAR